jgi:uncharacterized protein (DUF342 family)
VVGDVTAGATLSARDNIVIGGGVQGSTTRVVSMGNLHCRFVINASVMAVGDILVAKHISNAQVRAGKRIIVGSVETGRSGRVTGGKVFAAKSVEVGSIGAAAQTKTIVGCQPDVQTAVQMAKIRRSIEYCNRDIKRIARTLGAHSLTPDAIKRIIRRTTSSKKKFVRELLQKLKRVLDARAEQLVQLSKIEKSANEQFNGAMVEVGENIFGGTEVHFSEEIVQIGEDLNAFCYYWDGKSMRSRLTQ